MVDFTKLRRAGQSGAELEPVELFRTLPKPEHVNDLWDTQAAALRQWHERRTEPDLVIRLNTGSGKTLVGLLIAESLRREVGKPTLYLAPTRQLVEQVLERANEFSIPAEPYQAGGFQASFLSGEATLVATYHALFNGKTRFGLLGESETVDLGGVVLDDAHTSAATIRDIFSVTVSKSEHEELYRDLAGRFRWAFEKVHSAGRLDDMLGGRQAGVLEVPYWAWLDAAADVRSQLQAIDGDPFKFQLPLIRDHFEFCHALVSAESFVVTPILPPMDVVQSFGGCERRVFMSATLADDGALIRTFGARASGVASPISTRSVAGMGERMVLAPTLLGLHQDEGFSLAVDLCREAVSRGHGAVVLAPSEGQASTWSEVGDVCLGDEVSVAVQRLQQPESRDDTIPVLVNRYDGIDLPHDACRVLVLDGKPRGANSYDLYRASTLQGISSINIALAQRVEQGMGRGTRGAGDHCVVVLLGGDLVDWLGRKETLQVLTPGTRAQVELGREIAGYVSTPSDLRDAALQCLDRDNDWKSIHAERIAGAEDEVSTSEDLVAAGRLERRAFEQVLHQRPSQAADELESAADEEWPPAYAAWLLQLAARYAVHAGDEERAERLQGKAYARHRALMKPRGQIDYRALSATTNQAENVVAYIEQWAIRSAVHQSLDSIFADLQPEASANRFEEAIRRLGVALGLESDRPESLTGVGPDNLWLSHLGTAWVIECKHQKTTPLNKGEHGQLLVSIEWFEQAYNDFNCTPCFVHRDAAATTNSEIVGSDARILTFEALGRMKTALRAVYRELAFSSAPPEELAVQAARLLQDHGLDAGTVTSSYFVAAVEG